MVKNLESLGLRHERGKLLILDQQLLPREERWLECKTPDHMISAIKALKVRGAPLIGVAAAVSLARYALDGASPEQIRDAAKGLRAARPTAVNLMAACDRMVLNHAQVPTAEELARMAEEIFDEDVALCLKIGEQGAALIQDGEGILTHCNSGGLATAGIGTAFGILRRAHDQGKKIHVYADETRPLLQGARLTAWELGKLGIPYTLICDNMAAMVMSQGKVQRIFTGADRIAANGDAANKIGTYSLAVLAQYHRVPFYIAAPYTTVDKNCPTGAQIPIEERDADEVRDGRAPLDARVFNPAFDVTPRQLITDLILA